MFFQWCKIYFPLLEKAVLQSWCHWLSRYIIIKYLYSGNNTWEYINLCRYFYYSCSHGWQIMPWKYYNDIIFFIHVVWLFLTNVSFNNGSEISIKIPVKFRQCRVFSMFFWVIARWENTWKIPQKYRLNSASKTFRIAFLTEISSK